MIAYVFCLLSLSPLKLSENEPKYQGGDKSEIHALYLRVKSIIQSLKRARCLHGLVLLIYSHLLRFIDKE